jgi:subtilisin family serine protease
MTSIIAAIAPSATVMPIGIFDQSGTTDTFRIIEGLDYAMSMKARIIVLPFGSGSTQKSKFMEEAVAQAIKGGALVIAAAGNDSSQIGFPAALPGVFSVGAIDLEDKLAQFSNLGSSLKAVGPGIDILTLDSLGRIQKLNGTSATCAEAAGIAAPVWSTRPALSDEEVGKS